MGGTRIAPLLKRFQMNRGVLEGVNSTWPNLWKTKYALTPRSCMGGRVQGRAKPRCAGADLKPHILTKPGRFRFIGHNIAKPDSPCDRNAVQGTPGGGLLGPGLIPEGAQNPP